MVFGLTAGMMEKEIEQRLTKSLEKEQARAIAEAVSQAIERNNWSIAQALRQAGVRTV
jgi:hypothetical protein